MKGKVTDVQEEKLGTELAGDHSAGASSITVEDLGGLSWKPGGIGIVRNPLKTDQFIYTIASAPDEESDELELEEEPDADAGVVNVVPNLPVDYPDGAKVLQYPFVTERTAWVYLEDQEEEIPVLVTDPFLERLPTGTRKDPEVAETVEIDFVENEYVLRDVTGQPATKIPSDPDAVPDDPSPPDDVTVTSSDPDNPDVLATKTLEIEAIDQRVLVGVKLELLSGGTGVGDVHFRIDDGGFDIDTTNSRQVLDPIPALVPGKFDNPEVRFAYPVGVVEATPGTHTFRLTAYLDAAGSAPLANVRLWMAVL